MKKKTSYASMKHKSFRQAITQMFENEFKIVGSGKVIDLIVDQLMQKIGEYMPERIPPGEIYVSAISKDSPKGHQRGVKGLPQVAVKLPIIDEYLINRYVRNEKSRFIRKDYVISLFKKAYEQGGVLSSADVAVILKMSEATISKYVREYMANNEEIVPTRGFIHDVGPSISHKGIIVGKYLRGELPNAVARSTNHSQQAVDRYIKDYERVKLCLKKEVDVSFIKSATGMSKKLIIKYIELYKTYEGERHEQES